MHLLSGRRLCSDTYYSTRGSFLLFLFFFLPSHPTSTGTRKEGRGGIKEKRGWCDAESDPVLYSHTKSPCMHPSHTEKEAWDCWETAVTELDRWPVSFPTTSTTAPCYTHTHGNEKENGRRRIIYLEKIREGGEKGYCYWFKREHIVHTYSHHCCQRQPPWASRSQPPAAEATGCGWWWWKQVRDELTENKKKKKKKKTTVGSTHLE